MFKTARAAMMLRMALVCTLLVAAACRETPTGPPAVSTVTLTVPSNSVIAGSSQQLSVVVKAANGVVLTDRHVSWTTLNSAIATVNSTGILVATFPGVTTVFANVEGVAASSEVTVRPVPVASVALTPTTVSVTVGDAQQLTAILRDASGSFIAERLIAWTSANVSVATVSATGLVSAVAVGSTTITAVSEGQSGTATISVAAKGTPPAITSITPATLVPGAVATITGLRFDTLLTGNTVLVRGSAAQVLSASSTQLAVTVPCVNSGNVDVTVAVGNLTSLALVKPVAVPVRTIPIGQALVLTSNAESVCNELATTGATARYLVAVFSASTSQNTLVNFEIGGNTPPPFVAALKIAPRVVAASPSLQPSEDELRDDAHWRMLERDRAQYEELSAKARLLPPVRPSIRAAAVPAPGELRDFYFTFSGGCSSTATPMHTKAIYVGTRSVIWEDSENVLQSADNPDLTGYYQRLGQIFDQDQYESLKANFGDPLLRDAVTDADGRIHMVYSQRLNGSGGIGGAQ
ncbi:MAG: Ig-like domain-containing protein [Gemmatimonadaceae bacterium]